ncbi:response regulator [Photobacterium minamisatsumaniensis]|uniref:response regulator n=1 Tax=Photobacterium minamisatsumaniensis TaxID=2910233 RepID=UPI003D0EB0D3
MPTKPNFSANESCIELQPIKVLVVDDQRAAAALIKGVLQHIGLKDIDISLDHHNAIESCKKNCYDILFVDYHLDGALNGSELVNLLRRRKYITSHCGLIMISGDNSAEVILTSMAVEPDSFMTKPITTQTIKKKLLTTLNNCARRQPIYEAIESDGLDTAIELCCKQLQQYGYNHKLEGLLLDMMVTNGQWEQVERYTHILLKNNPSPKLSLIEVKVLHHQGKLQQAIKKLEQLIARSPLNIELYDYLATYQAEGKLYYEALETAEKALKLTPTISHRALKVAQLAASLERMEQLTNSGKTLASHLPIIDVEWIICFAEYTAIFEQAYYGHSSKSLKHELKTALKGIIRRAHSRVLPIQQPFLTSFSHIIQARLALANDQPLKAKRRILVGLSTYFNKITKLPSVMIADALPVLLHFGETQLISELNNALSLRDRFDGHSKIRLNEIKQNKPLLAGIKVLETKLSQANQLREGDTSTALNLYEQILHNYPLCSEAHLGRLDCLSRLCTDDTVKIKASLKAITSMPLPDGLEQWRKQLFEDMQTLKAPPHQAKIVRTYQARTHQFLLNAS